MTFHGRLGLACVIGVEPRIGKVVHEDEMPTGSETTESAEITDDLSEESSEDEAESDTVEVGNSCFVSTSIILESNHYVLVKLAEPTVFHLMNYATKKPILVVKSSQSFKLVKKDYEVQQGIMRMLPGEHEIEPSENKWSTKFKIV